MSRMPASEYWTAAGVSSLRNASYTIITAVPAISSACNREERFSNFSCPKWCVLSSGSSAFRMPRYASTEARRSKRECTDSA